jgi:hypothetical protein
MQGTSKHDPSMTPATISWRGVTLRKWYATRLTTTYRCRNGVDDPLLIELKQLGADNFTVTMTVYRLTTYEQGHCDNLDEVRAMLDRCLDGLHGLLQDGLKAVEQVQREGDSNGT